MAVIVGPPDLAALLGTDFDEDDSRALAILGWAQALCESVVSPLPAGAEAVVLSVASRAYANPVNAQQQTAGPYNASYGSGASGGLYLSRQDLRTLLRLAGIGGAFTFDVTPAGAGENLSWWNVDLGVPPGGDFDEIP